jgi:hypothetical protein
MAPTRDVIIYVITRTSGTKSLSLLKLTTLLYLADWRGALTLGKQITDIAWIQPFVAKMPEVAKYLVSNHSDFSIAHSDHPENPPEVFFVGDPLSSYLPQEARETVEFVLRSASQKLWPELFRLAYSTYPMLSQPTHSTLNLIELAARYKDALRTPIAG